MSFLSFPRLLELRLFFIPEVWFPEDRLITLLDFVGDLVGECKADLLDSEVNLDLLRLFSLSEANLVLCPELSLVLDGLLVGLLFTATVEVELFFFFHLCTALRT